MSELPSPESTPPSFDELVDRCTARFKRDRALRGELGQELASHLKASRAEYVAAEFSEAAAHAATMRDFGDADEVAQGLWAANRRRLSWRFWGWWVARVTLLPGCVLLVAGLLMQGVIAGGILVTGPYAVDQTPLGKWQEDRLKARLSDEQRLRYFGDDAQADPVDQWRAVRDRWPTEPRWQLKLIAELLQRDEASGWPNPARPAMDVPAFLRELERGRVIDPDNGVYDLLEASVVLNRSGDMSEDEREGDAPEMFLRWGGGDAGYVRHGVSPYRWHQPPSDEAVDHARQMLRRARSLPVVSMGYVALMLHQVKQLPPPRSLGEYMQRVTRTQRFDYATIGAERVLCRAIEAEAVRFAEAGRGADASAMIDDLEAVVRKAAASRGTLLGVLASASEVGLVNHARVFVARAVGDHEGAEAAIAVADAMTLRYNGLMREGLGVVSGSQDLKEAGFVMSMIAPAVPGYAVDFEPFRLAEYVWMDRVAMTLVVGGLTALAGLGALVGLWMAGRREAPLLMWIGWRRLAKVVGVSVVVPTLVFVVWSRSPWGGRGFGIDQRPWLLLGSVFAAALVGWSALAMGLQALRQRAVEVGLAVPVRSETSGGRRWLGWAGQGLVWTGLVVVPAMGIAGAGGSSTAVTLWCVLVGAAAMWAALAGAVVRMRGVARPRAAVVRVGGGLLLLTVLVALGGWVYLRRGNASDTLVEVASWGLVWWSVLVGGVGLIRLARRPGTTTAFARSAVRSLTPVLAACALVGGVLWGPLLSWREASLALRLVEVSPVFVDLEVERSNAKALRTWLAGDAERPPRLR